MTSAGLNPHGTAPKVNIQDLQTYAALFVLLVNTISTVQIKLLQVIKFQTLEFLK
jgi:hypothetical protein